MTDTVVSLVAAGYPPDRIEECLLLANWRGMEREIRQGLPVGMTAYGGTSLFELILSAQENAPRGNAPLPMSLLDALMEHGLGRAEVEHDRGMTAVSLCAEYGQWAWMKRLIEEDFQIETPQWPALCAIAFGRHSRFGNWVEHFAEENEQAEVEPSAKGIKVVSLHPVSPERTCPFDQAWHEMLKETTDMRDAVLRLVGCGVDIDACPTNLMPSEALVPEGARRGGSALLAAIDKDDREYARALIAAGADLNSVYASWLGPNSATIITPLGVAISKNWSDIVLSILQTGEGMVPVPYTEQGELRSMHPLRMIMTLNDDVDRFDLIGLIAAHMHPDAVQQEGILCMQQAALFNRVDYLKALHELGVPYNACTANGFQPIHQACSQGSVETIEFLLDHGAKLTDTSATGVSAASLLLDKPELAKRFNATEHTDNVRMFRRRK